MESSLTPFFRPASVAVVGASREPGTVGWRIVENLVRHGFQGPVYPVNPRARSIHSIPAWRSVREIPGDVDLAVIAVPADRVLDVVDECGSKGVPAVLVITAGFREVGGEGVERERRLTERVHRHGMRLVGPNCMGVLNTDPEVSLNATFAPTMPPAGPVSFLSQSGALGVTILDYAAEYAIGIRNFVSVGNKADVSGNDLLEYWESDRGTRVVLMYLESFGNPRKFTTIARRVSRRKPIVVVKSGRTGAGARAASSHTGALAGTDATVDALLAQCGVHRADTVEELFDLAMAFGSLPTPRSNRVAIVTNAGGPGIIIADACEAEGLEVTELTAGTRARLAEIFPAEASVRNPVDMIATATADDYRAALNLVLDDPNVDAAIPAFVPPVGVRQRDVAASIVDAARRHPETPVLAVLMGREGLPAGRAQLREAGVPAYIFPESAARALAALRRQGRWLERPVQAPATFPVDSDRVASLVRTAREEGRTILTEEEGYSVLEAYGIPTVAHRLAASEEEAVAAAESLGYPVVLKAVSPEILHKTEAGAVLLELGDPVQVRAGYQDLQARVRRHHPEAGLRGVLVASHRRGGRELALGLTTDPTFGPVLMFGFGGIYLEILRDVAFRIPPLTEVEAREMIRSVRGHPLLEGVRGEPGVRVDPVVESLQRLSQLAGDHPEIVEVDVNPFLATPEEALALDARMVLGVP